MRCGHRCPYDSFMLCLGNVVGGVYKALQMKPRRQPARTLNPVRWDPFEIEDVVDGVGSRRFSYGRDGAGTSGMCFAGACGEARLPGPLRGSRGWLAPASGLVKVRIGVVIGS